jgi:putative NIF3 family GTP cyclohydrolase 1 type 2
MPKKYEKINVDYCKYYESKFLERYHGLALKNSNNVKKVFLTVFLSDDVIAKILAKNEKDVLVFSHHPMDMQTGGCGTIPLSEKYLIKMKEQNISAYVLHSPLDVNDKISTSASLAKILEISAIGRYNKEEAGFHGVYGFLPEKMLYENFIEKIKKELNISKTYDFKKTDYVYKVGVIAGGGSDMSYILETSDLGCDTYLTGDYINRINSEAGEQDRAEFESQKNNININLIACSHYASEKCVLITEIKKYFSDLGVICEFIGNDDVWK